MEMIDSNREQSKMIRKTLSCLLHLCKLHKITTKTFLEHGGIHGTENGFG